MIAAYVDMMRIRFLTWLAYRVNYYSGILIYLIYIGGYYFFWQAAYGGRSQLGGMDITQMVTYLAASWMARAFYFNSIDREIAQEIDDGTVAVRFTQPYSYLLGKMAMALGEGVFRLLFFSLPGLALAALLFPIALPADPGRWLWWLVAIFLAFVINTQINALIGLLAFFLVRVDGLIRAKRLTTDLLSGVFLPLDFFPAAVRVALQWLPFQGIAYLPSRILSGAATAGEVLGTLALQVTWIAVLGLGLRVLWVQAVRKLELQGG